MSTIRHGLVGDRCREKNDASVMGAIVAWRDTPELAVTVRYRQVVPEMVMIRPFKTPNSLACDNPCQVTTV